MLTNEDGNVEINIVFTPEEILRAIGVKVTSANLDKLDELLNVEDMDDTVTSRAYTYLEQTLDTDEFED
ncbi:hypothetical protein ACLUWO_05105 [Pseudoscardovia radai]|uniref:hypothetical protein n=1 Tax=Pseudoscardovia radai TaxID=987066 RepID=UPI00399105BF